jgi:cytochrome c peroxidase
MRLLYIKSLIMKKSILISSALIISGIVACSRIPSSTSMAPLNQKAPNLPAETPKYSEAVLPSGQTVNEIGFGIEPGLIDPINGGLTTFPSNTNAILINDDMANLGRVLFYDVNLSLNNTVSCGSCHHQEQAFADGKAVSHGFEGRITNRSSMAFANPITQKNLFWDSRSSSLIDLALRPVQNHIEMGMEDMPTLIAKLSKVNYYPGLFTKAYGDANISELKISNAIAQFVASITTSDSKFDRVNLPNATENLTTMENLGHQVFTENCASCHNISTRVTPGSDGPSDIYNGGGNNNPTDPTVNNKSANGTTNIGLDLEYKDNGFKEGQFKIPSLRNIMLTAPYMHDGRFANIDQVIEHYTHGIKQHKNLDVKLRTVNGKKPIVLDELQKQALKAFLSTLTDDKMTHDPKYSDPFQ